MRQVELWIDGTQAKAGEAVHLIRVRETRAGAPKLPTDPIVAEVSLPRAEVIRLLRAPDGAAQICAMVEV